MKNKTKMFYKTRRISNLLRKFILDDMLFALMTGKTDHEAWFVVPSCSTQKRLEFFSKATLDLLVWKMWHERQIPWNQRTTLTIIKQMKPMIKLMASLPSAKAASLACSLVIE